MARDSTIPIRTAFTLIELLVVVTIIVVLLALLAPAMDQAIYQAELATCAAQQDALAAGTVSYTLAHQRAYPYRTILEVSNQSQPILLYRSKPQSEIAMLGSFLSINDHLQDPLVTEVDLTITMFENQHVWVYASIAYWAGWRFTDTGRKGMRRLGDAFEFENEHYRLMASDHDMVAISEDHIQSKHPDADGVMYNLALQNEIAANLNPDNGAIGVSTARITYSTWTADHRTYERGLIDMNAAFDDGSVRRYASVPADTREDERMARLPAFSNALRWFGGEGYGVNVPRPIH